MFKKLFAAVAGLMCLASQAVFCETALSSIIQKGKLVIGTEAGYPPFEYKDKDGKIIGFDIDVVNKVAEAMNVKVEVKEYKFEELIPALNAGEIDLIVSGMTKTLERALKVNFTEPYYQTGQVVVVGSSLKNIEMKKLDDIAYKIGVQKGTTGEKMARVKFPNAKIETYDNIDMCSIDLLKNKIDAFIYDSPLANIFVNSYPQQAYILSFELTKEYYCMAVKQGDFDFLNWLNYFINSFVNKEEYNKIFTYWFAGPQKK